MQEASKSPLVSFEHHQPSFQAITGSSPSIILLQEDANGQAAFHEACVYHPSTQSVFVSSNQLPICNDQSGKTTLDKKVTISRIYDRDYPADSTCVDATPPDLVMANGGANYLSGLLFCAQGSKSNSSTSGLVYVPNPEDPVQSQLLISSFHGRPFNSVNDVIVHPLDGSIWFTDPCYGYHQGFRTEPDLPSQLYRLGPEKGNIRAMADDFVRPNGLCFSPDLMTLYVTDTGAVHGASEVPFSKTGKASIYAFDIYSAHQGPFLTNRRLFAFVDSGIPDGVKCDIKGNVYSGCGDGVNIFNPGGLLIGKILVRGGVANLCFGEKGAIYLCNETRIWKAQLDGQVRGAVLGL